MRPLISANEVYVMLIDGDSVTRVATERFSNLALIRAIEELSDVLGDRLRKESGHETSSGDMA